MSPPSVARIYLIGFMGAGKTTVGRLLAQRLAWQFYDIDSVIEAQHQKSVAELFALRGEAAFRTLEHKAISHLQHENHAVISLGGGAIETPEVRALLHTSAGSHVIFLEAPLDILVDRCVSQDGGAARPILQDREHLGSRYNSRLAHYRNAHHTVATQSLTPEKVAALILDHLAALQEEIMQSNEAVSSNDKESVATPPRSHRGDIVFTFALAIGLYLAFRVRDVLILLYVSALFAVVLTPVVRAISRLRIGKWSPGHGLSMLILFLGVALAAGLFIGFALPPALHDLSNVVRDLPQRLPELLARLKRLPLASHINIDQLNAKLQGEVSGIASGIFGYVSDWASGFVRIITGLVLTIYFMIEGDVAYQWALSFFPQPQRERLNRTLLVADTRMGKWLVGQASLMLILGVCSTIVFALMHIRYAYALGVLMGIFNIIPVVGALISMSLVILAAATESWGKVIGVCIFYGVYVNVENSYLTPKIMKSSVDLAGLAVMVALLLGSEFEGVLGAMVAVPTAVLIAVLLQEYAQQNDAVVPAK